MKKTLCCFLAVLLLMVLTGCASKKAETALDTALDALVSGNGQDVPLLGLDGSPMTGFENEGLAQVITSQLQYKIKNVSTSGSKATATVEITAPDTPAIMQEVLDGMDAYDEETFIRRMTDELDDSTPSATFTVEVELQCIDDIWYLVPNAQLSNAMTGGLLQAYADEVQRIQDAIREGN